jgi:hypothetical protein
MRRLYCLCIVLVLVCAGSSVFAGQDIPAAQICFLCRNDTIYGLTSLIAYLEANPDVDDAYKGPIITAARAKILQLRAEGLFPPQPVYPTPCCYTRKPLYIR